MRIFPSSILGLAVASVAGLGGKLLPIPVAFSNPETGLGGGAKLRWLDPFDKPGMYDIMGYVTEKGQVHGEFELLRDSIAGVWRLDATVEAGKFPGKWFGEGNPPPDSLASIYTPVYVGATLGAGRWLSHGWLVGAKLILENWQIRNDGLGVNRNGHSVGESGGLETNVGFEAIHEGRDQPADPRRGAYLKIASEAALPGTDFDWQNLSLDASYALSVSDFTGVVRTRYEEAWGGIPFWRTPFLGNRKSLRGIPDKRLRGNVAQCVGTEFRWHGPKYWVTAFQPAVFGELGRAGGHSDVWSADVNWAAGGGVRFPLADGKAVLRADYGWSEVGSGLYVDFGHAF